VTAEKFFGITMLGTAGYNKDLWSAMWADNVAAFQAVDHLKKQEKGEAATGYNQVSSILLVGTHRKEHQAYAKCNDPDDHK
jgi:hypothetical protein